MGAFLIPGGINFLKNNIPMKYPEVLWWFVNVTSVSSELAGLIILFSADWVWNVNQINTWVILEIPGISFQHKILCNPPGNYGAVTLKRKFSFYEI